MHFIEIGRYAKDLAAALGIGGVLWGAYSSSGLPVPATITQVDTKIAAIETSLKGEIGKVREAQKATDVNVLVGQRSIVALRKGFLRNEQSGLIRLLEASDVATKTTLRRRLGQIDDELKELDAEDETLRKRITG